MGRIYFAQARKCRNSLPVARLAAESGERGLCCQEMAWPAQP